MKKKIVILCSNLASNAFGRSFLLASMLRSEFNVEIFGPLYNQQKIWEPLRRQNLIPIKSFVISDPPKSYQEIRNMYQKIDADIIYANKTYFFSIGLGLVKKLRYKTPLVVDIDDWDLGFALYRYRQMCLKNIPKYCFRWFMQLPRFYQSNRPASMLFYEMLVRFADDITVSNSYLQKRFGGHLIPHVRDTDVLCPENYSNPEIRHRLNIPFDQTIISFIGTPRAFKGIEDLVEAVSMIDDPNLTLMIVGIDSEDAYTRKLEPKMDLLKKQKRLILYGQQPVNSLPEFLAVSDIVAIPQRKCIATIGQVPAKVFDAMAMEKSIVATAVSDLPEILSDCGWIVKPGNPEDLADVIRSIVTSHEITEKRKKHARSKCIDHYSTAFYKSVLINVFKNIKRKL